MVRYHKWSNNIYYTSLRKEYYRKKQLSNPTVYEMLLWNEIKDRKLGVSFTRQKVIIGYIVDFYSQKYRLAIEVDGDTHDSFEDRKRDMALANVGIHVVRISNHRLIYDLEGAIKEISKEIEVSKKLYTKRVSWSLRKRH